MKVASARAHVPDAEASQRVLIERRTRNRRPLAALVVAVWAAFVVVLANVAPAVAATTAGPTKLVNPSVSPRSGTTSTKIVFEVGYRNRTGTAPDRVDVVIDGVRHRMTATGTDWKLGVVLRWSSTLTAGSHGVRFEAEDTRKFTDGVGGGSVTITKPASTPTPTPTPPPSSTPTPHPTPGSGGSTGGSGGSTGGSGGSTGGSGGSAPGGGTTGGSGGSLDSPWEGGAPGSTGGSGGDGSWGGVVPGLGSGPDGSAAGAGRSDSSGAGARSGSGGGAPESGAEAGAEAGGPMGPTLAGGSIGGSAGQIRFGGWGDLGHALEVLGI